MRRIRRRPKKLPAILSIISKTDGSVVGHLDRNDLVYRAEGNANLVLAIPHMQQVLRLGKSSRNSDHPSNDHVIMVTEYGRIMSSLFTADFTIEPKLVFLRIPNYQSLNNWLNQFRPSMRCDKEIKCRAGILYPDLAILRRDLLPENIQVKGETYCVEIKPKQGWTLPKDILEALFPDSDGQFCRFCAMQYLKLVRQTIKRVSNYCPIDLFSGDRTRMLKALQGLVETPQNNFRMWRSGHLIYGDGLDSARFREALEDVMCQRDHTENLDSFLELLLEAVQKDYTGMNVPNQNPPRPGSVLQQILDVQLLARDNLQLAAYASAVDNEQSFKIVERITEKLSTGNSATTLDGVERYFLGATALDCSLMVTFQKVQSGDGKVSSSMIRVADQNFIVSMTVMDLDPKADSHPFKYIKQTRMSYKAQEDFLKRVS